MYSIQWKMNIFKSFCFSLDKKRSLSRPKKIGSCSSQKTSAQTGSGSATLLFFTLQYIRRQRIKLSGSEWLIKSRTRVSLFYILGSGSAATWRGSVTLDKSGCRSLFLVHFTYFPIFNMLNPPGKYFFL